LRRARITRTRASPSGGTMTRMGAPFNPGADCKPVTNAFYLKVPDPPHRRLML